MAIRTACLLLLVSVCLSPASGQQPNDASAEEVRQTIATAQAAIKAHPTDPKPYIDLAYAYSDAGMGEMAVDAARRATDIAPTSSFAYNARAWVTRHNAIGVDFGKGFDYDAALGLYRRAEALDPNDYDIRATLANVYEHGRSGIEYGPEAELDYAIAEYQYILDRQRKADPETATNLAIDLFYAGRYKQAMQRMQPLPPSDKGNGIIVAAMAATSSTTAAIDWMKHQAQDEERRREAFEYAAEGLWNMRLYPQAADVLEATLPDNSDNGHTVIKVDLFRHLKPHVDVELPEDDPRKPVQHMMNAVIEGRVNKVIVRESFSARLVDASERANRSDMASDPIAAAMNTLERESGLPRAVVEDLIFGVMTLQAGPVSDSGNRVSAQIFGKTVVSFFVLKEDGSYRIAAGGGYDQGIGEEALYLAEHHAEPNATALLNWRRETEPAPSETGDPLGGTLFARLWPATATHKPASIQLAAASLITDKPTLQLLLPQLEQAASTGQDLHEQQTIQLMLTTVYLRLGEAEKALNTANQLLKKYPDSPAALALAGRAVGQGKHWAEWRSLLDKPLERHPTDRPYLLLAAEEAEAEGDTARAHILLRGVIDSSGVTQADLLHYAWLSLFEDQADPRALAAAERANQMSGRKSYDALRTLACLHAVAGDTAQARQLLLDAMNAAHLDEPNDELWLGFGLIDEQYGVNEAAAAAYRRLRKPDDAASSTTSAYQIAQQRLKRIATP